MGYKILGFDPGPNNTGWALLENKGGSLKLLEWGVVEVPRGKDFSESLHFFAGSVSSVITAFSPDVVAIESPIPRRSSLILGFVSGIIAGLAYSMEVREIVFINPSEEKKYGGKKGNRIVLKNLLGVDITSHHARDAAVVAVVAFDRKKEAELCCPDIS